MVHRTIYLGFNMDMFYQWVQRKFARIGDDGNDVRSTPSPWACANTVAGMTSRPELPRAGGWGCAITIHKTACNKSSLCVQLRVLTTRLTSVKPAGQIQSYWHTFQSSTIIRHPFLKHIHVTLFLCAAKNLPGFFFPRVMWYSFALFSSSILLGNIPVSTQRAS